MKNKFLVFVKVPMIDYEMEIYIPNNKKIGTIKKYLLDYITKNTDNLYNKKIDEVNLINGETGEVFDNNLFVKDSPIKNATKIIIL